MEYEQPGRISPLRVSALDGIDSVDVKRRDLGDTLDRLIQRTEAEIAALAKSS